MDAQLAVSALIRMSEALQVLLVENAPRKFHAELRNLAVLGFTSEGSILGAVRELVRTSVRDAYIEGLYQGGIPEAEMTPDDQSAIATLIQNQLSYVTDFVRDVRAARRDRAAQREILVTRINFWTASIEAAATAGLNSAKENEMVTWKLGGAEVHCKGPNSCTWLDGQKHRRKWFVSRGVGAPRTPGQGTPCKGFNCQCTLE